MSRFRPMLARANHGIRGPMPTKKPPDPNEKPQKKRFIEAARKAEVDEAEFEKVMRKLLPAKRPKR